MPKNAEQADELEGLDGLPAAGVLASDEGIDGALGRATGNEGLVPLDVLVAGVDGLDAAGDDGSDGPLEPPDPDATTSASKQVEYLNAGVNVHHHWKVYIPGAKSSSISKHAVHKALSPLLQNSGQFMKPLETRDPAASDSGVKSS